MSTRVLFEIMSAHHDAVVEDCDTDAVSINSTEAESEEVFYNADCIIAEDLEKEYCYLVKWENYPLHDCTWEPPANLDATELISDWEQVKRELGEAVFRHENEKNTEAFKKAQETAEAARERRHEKREKKRRRLRRRTRSVAVPGDDSSDEGRLASAPSRATGGESLFVESHGSSVPASSFTLGSRVRRSPVARKAPLQQSSSEEEIDSDVQSPDDCSISELPKKEKAQQKANQIAVRNLTGNTVFQSEYSKKTEAPTEGASKIAPSMRVRESRTIEKETGQPMVSAAPTGPTVQQAAAAALFNDAEDGRTVVSTTASEMAGNGSSRSTAMRTIRTTQRKQTTCAIKIIDQPIEKQRKAWSTDHQYNKLKFRGLAQKRSCTEKVPDFSVLNFVHGPPPALPKAPAPNSNGEPYGRREITNCRVQEDDSDDDPRRRPGRDPAPLAEWEIGKVPLMCASWRLSSNCPYGAQRCFFMHREFDSQGQAYPLGDRSGRVPQKYRKPPITCAYWYKGGVCRNSAEECLYAHEDTGWAEIDGEPIRIEHLPIVSADPAPRDLPPAVGLVGNHGPPVTCPFWLWAEISCNKDEDECQFAHRNTGWSFSDLNSMNKPVVQIDPNLKPRGTQPKSANPPITCPFWFRGKTGCGKSKENCRFAHWNTGWAPSTMHGGDQLVNIDPNALPQSQRMKSDKNITCSSWLRDADSCTRTEAECKYAHHNTGWALPRGNKPGPPVKLDPNQIPRSHRDQMKGTTRPCKSLPGDPLPPNRRLMPHEITCRFWLNGPRSCNKTEKACKFAHKNTGWITPWLPGANVDGAPERIDLNLEPVYKKRDTPEKSRPHDRFGTSSTSATIQPSAITLEVDVLDAVQPIVASDVVETLEQQDVDAPLATQNAPLKQLPAATPCSRLRYRIAQIYNLNITEMFGSSGDINSDNMTERRAMLLYHPEDHARDLELITRWLSMHAVETGNPWYDGAWSHFKQQVAEDKLGIIIVHPDFEQYTDLPDFGKILKKSIRVWSVGLQPAFDFEPGLSAAPPVLRHDCIRIFPHGGFIYITDEVFEQKPQLALSIIKLFSAKIEQLRNLDGPVSPWHRIDDACLLWRLCVRPELMEYLYQKCEDNPKELVAGNLDYLSRAELYQLLTSTNYIEQDHPIEPLSPVQDKYPILSERRVIAETQPLDYFNRLANSQEDANTYMIGYYAAMQADLRRDYRQFYIVHTEPDAACAQQWKTSVQTIAEIITPEQCIEELEKASKESLFDFLDWAMQPKEKERSTVPMDVEALQHAAY